MTPGSNVHSSEELGDVGDALLRRGAVREAAEAFRNALSARPTDIRISLRLISALELLGDAAETCGAWVHLGLMLRRNRRWTEAVAAFRRALACKPDCLLATYRLAECNLFLGNHEEAVRAFKATQKLCPDHDWAHNYLGQIYLLTGEADLGWNEYAFQFEPRTLRAQEVEQPVWDGTPLNGRTILLWTTQGLGDTIQFIRYVSFAKEKGGRVIVECHAPRLIPLISRMPDVDRVVTKGSPSPAFDVHAPLVNFPASFPETRKPILNRVPYLSADPTLQREWRQRLNPTGEPLVGLCWAGNEDTATASTRFPPVATALEALADLEGVRLVSLQYGVTPEQLRALPHGHRVEHLGDTFFSISDAAAIITNLDLVITVDTMLAHLAGSLGAQVWTILGYPPYWIWGLQGERSHWYPTMRLFRRARSEAWTSVLARVKTALRSHAFTSSARA